MLVSLLGCPDNTGGGTRGIETCVRLVTFVRFAEVAVNAGAKFYAYKLANWCQKQHCEYRKSVVHLLSCKLLSALELIPRSQCAPPLQYHMHHIPLPVGSLELENRRCPWPEPALRIGTLSAEKDMLYVAISSENAPKQAFAQIGGVA